MRAPQGEAEDSDPRGIFFHNPPPGGEMGLRTSSKIELGQCLFAIVCRVAIVTYYGCARACMCLVDVCARGVDPIPRSAPWGYEPHRFIRHKIYIV